MIARQKIPAKVPVTYKQTYQYTDMTSGTTAQNFTLVGIPADWVVTGIRIQNITTWAATSLSSLQVQIGTAASPSAYANPYELTNSVTSTSVQISSPFTCPTTVAHDIIVRFVATGASMNAMSAGKLEVTLRVEPL